MGPLCCEFCLCCVFCVLNILLIHLILFTSFNSFGCGILFILSEYCKSLKVLFINLQSLSIRGFYEKAMVSLTINRTQISMICHFWIRL